MTEFLDESDGFTIKLLAVTELNYDRFCGTILSITQLFKERKRKEACTR